MIIRVLMMLISTFLIAFGIFMYVPADIMPLAGEGAIITAVLIGTELKCITKLLGSFRNKILAIEGW